MKRIISALLILMMLIPPMVIPAQAATLVHADSVVRVTADKANPAVGEEVTVTVSFENIPACSAVDFSLVYDTEYLKINADSDVKKNVSGYSAQNHVYIMEERPIAELQGKTAVKVVSANDGNCLKGTSGTLFTAKFVVQKNTPASGTPLEFIGVFNDRYTERDLWNTIEVVNTSIVTATTSKQVSSVSLASAPSKAKYVQGQALDLEGGHLAVTFADGSSEQVRLSAAQVTEYDYNKIGAQTVKMAYAGKTVSFDIETEAAVLTSISMCQLPSTIEYIKGQNTAVSKSGGVLMLHYNGGITKTLAMSDSEVSVSGYDSSVLGNQDITVTYKGLETTYKIAVVKKYLSQIDVRTPMVCKTCQREQDAIEMITAAGGTADDKSTLTKRLEFIENAEKNVTCLYDDCEGTTFETKMKRVYYLNENFDVQNAVLFVTYTDGSTEELPMTLDMVKFRNTIATTDSVDITYGSKSTSIPRVLTKKKEVISIAVAQNPDKMTYIKGQRFDPKGGKLLVTYNSGDTEEISMSHSDVTISKTTLSELGDNKITLKYKYKSAILTVRVNPREVVSIAMDTSAKSVYFEDEPLDLNAKLIVTYNDDTTEIAYLRDATVSGYNPAVLGSREVTVTYAEKTCKWQVLVEERPIILVETLEIVGDLPASIVEGLDLNLEDCTLTATYENEDVEEEIEITPEMIAFDRKTGVVTITYKNATVSFEIEILPREVVEIQIEGTLPTTLLEKLELDMSDCTLTAIYNNGEVEEDIEITPAMLTYSNEVGTQTVTISYKGKESTFSIEVLAKTAERIAVTTFPRTYYLEGKDTALDLAGGKITVYYDNGDRKTVNLSANMVSGFSAAVGDHTILVQYEGCQTEYHITVHKKSILGVAIAALPTKMMYRQGVDRFDPKGGKITVFYDNDTQEVKDLSANMVSGFSNLFEGDCTLTVVYEGFLAEFTVLILKENPFKDVQKGEYFEEPVLWAVTLGITTGVDATAFAPNNECTRGQIVTFLWRAAGEPKPQSSQNPFRDVHPTDYYYNAVLWAVEQGITNGMSPGEFAPNATCTRGQVVTFMWRANKNPATQATNQFTDVQSNAYYYNAVLWAVKNDITNGTSATTFAPENTCTRGQIVTFLYRGYN